MKKVQYNSLQKLTELAIKKQLEQTVFFKSQNRGRLDGLLCTSLSEEHLPVSVLDPLSQEITSHVKPGELFVARSQLGFGSKQTQDGLNSILLPFVKQRTLSRDLLTKFKTAIIEVNIDAQACEQLCKSGEGSPFPQVVPETLNGDLMLSTGLLQRESTLFTLIPGVPSMANRSKYPVNEWLLRRIIYEMVRYYVSSGATLDVFWGRSEPGLNSAQGRATQDLLLGFSSQQSKVLTYYTHGKYGSIPFSTQVTQAPFPLSQYKNITNLDELEKSEFQNPLKLAKKAVREGGGPLDQRKVWLDELPNFDE